MNGEQYRKVIDFENGLKVGDECIARWTLCGYFYQTVVRVRKVNTQSFGVAIEAPLDGYPMGWGLNIPRIANIRRWSANNRLEPMKGVA
jgi:hypothetical protein